MKIDDLDFSELGNKERKLLLTALEIPLDNLQCYYCADNVDYKICGIMPPLKRGEIGRITCSSPLCISEYLMEYEESQ